ncbi:hypothetical protein CIK05_14955 [Bdellovibrio sp. qaytius]|nr:hypothetical protein CIK05_14955 [Bdellovibrio sp. qaytius]
MLNVNHLSFKFIILSLLLTTLVGCGGQGIQDGTTSSPATASEVSFCSTSTSYSPGVAVSGTAKFLRRGANIGTSSGIVTSVKIGAVISTPLPIKYAEIRVLLNGATVQCGTTNSIGELRALDGTTPLFLPNSAGSYTIEVNSRANFIFPSTGKPASATLSVAVKEDTYSNTLYKLSGTYTSLGFGNGSNSPLNLVAQANENVSAKIEGGAFNIYNDWVTAFEYLTSTSNTASLDVSCLSPRLDIFWKKGFNPAAYISGADINSAISFYLRDNNELYLSGGISDNVTTADTDQWDDSVILHEMGHHIENMCGRMDSPGGSHNANARIDPRLAWSEGWGDFMGGHMVRNNTAKINPNLVSSLPNGEWLFYSDTSGYYDGSGTDNSASLILIRLSSLGASSAHDPVDASSYPGESHTREASIARGLFKGVNTCATNCGGGVGFDKYWTALGTTSGGMGLATSPFSSSAKFFAKVYTANSSAFSASMTTIMTNDEALQMAGSTSFTVMVTVSSTGLSSATNAWPGYARKLTTAGSCTQNLLQPRAPNATYGRRNDQRYSNHFFTFRKADLSGVTQIRLVPDSSCSVDLDLLILNPTYDYPEEYCTHYDSFNRCDANSKYTTLDSDIALLSRGSTNSEAITITGLTSSYYLLNVRGFSATPQTIPSNSACVYKLTDQTGRTLCPSSY